MLDRREGKCMLSFCLLAPLVMYAYLRKSSQFLTFLHNLCIWTLYYKAKICCHRKILSHPCFQLLVESDWLSARWRYFSFLIIWCIINNNTLEVDWKPIWTKRDSHCKTKILKESAWHLTLSQLHIVKRHDRRAFHFVWSTQVNSHPLVQWVKRGSFINEAGYLTHFHSSDWAQRKIAR